MGPFKLSNIGMGGFCSASIICLFKRENKAFMRTGKLQKETIIYENHSVSTGHMVTTLLGPKVMIKHGMKRKKEAIKYYKFLCLSLKYPFIAGDSQNSSKHLMLSS